MNSPEPPSPLKARKPTPRGSRADILVVDNDTRIVELLSWFLSKRGFHVRSAGSFAEARVILRAWRPDLMLSDVDMGAENALEELPRMNAEGCLPPTLVVSGFLDAASTARLEALEPVLGTLPKPFDFLVLEARVESLLGGVARGAAASRPVRVAGSIPAPLGGSKGESREDWIEIAPLDPEGARNLSAAQASPSERHLC